MGKSLKLAGLSLTLVLAGVAPSKAELSKLLPTSPQPNGGFGTAVAADGGVVAIGMDRDDPFQSTGGVEFFAQGEAGGWLSEGFFPAPDPVAMNTIFGQQIVLEGGDAFVAAAGVDEGRGAVYWMTRDGAGKSPWRHRLEITAPNAQPTDSFGNSLALQGDRLVVGAPRVADPDSRSLCGAVFIYGRVGEAWVLQQTLQPVADCLPQGLGFGSSLSLDSDRLAIGSNWGLFVYDRISGVWQKTARLQPAPDAGNNYSQFGRRVALAGDRMLIASPTWGDFPGRSAYVYEKAAGTWTRVAELIISDPGPIFGLGIGLALQGDLAVLGCPTCPEHASNNPGAVYVFERQPGGAWVQVRRHLGPSGPFTYFGYAADFDGTRAWIGALNDNDGITWGTGAAYVVELGPAVFGDGFESGTLAAWSAAVP